VIAGLQVLSNAVLNRCARFDGRKTTKGESYEKAITFISNPGIDHDTAVDVDRGGWITCS
jgi:hypothetical protein